MDKKKQITDAINKVQSNMDKKKTPREVLLGIKSRLQEILKDVENAIANSEGWHDSMALDAVHQQIQDSRWNH